MLAQSVRELIGNTPIVQLDSAKHGLKHIELYAKLENMNPFGSLKDRIAKTLLDKAIEEVRRRHKTVIEASSGNTSKSLAVLCATEGVAFKAFSNRIKIKEQRMFLKVLGAGIEELPGLSNCLDPNDPTDPLNVIRELTTAEPDAYHNTDQYYDEDNYKTHYETTGAEIHADIGLVDYFIGSLGTCGSSYGIGTYLKEKNPGAKVVGTLAEAGNWIPGLRNMNELWEIGNFHKDFYDEIIPATTHEAIDGMLELARNYGVLGGPSSGLNYFIALRYLRELDKTLDGDRKLKAVFLVSDRLENYLNFLEQSRPELFAVHEGTVVEIPRVANQTVTAGEAAELDITAAELKQQMADNASMLVIDTRNNFAYKMGHITGSINIMDETLMRIVETGESFPPDAQLVIVCRIGDQSRLFAKFLRAQGYSAFSLQDGIRGWKEKYGLER